ncbi:MAG: amidohydrolase family protein, partial [Pseudomonadota bacterium]
MNSRALARARGSDGTELGLSAATLADEFAAFRDVVGVDANGVPNGRIAEHARALLAPESVWGFDVDVASITADIAAKLAENGITSVQDTWMYPEQLRTWLAWAGDGDMSFRLVAALFPRMQEYRRGLDGEVDIPRVLKALRALRASAESVDLVAADGVKIFIDGVIEGNPLADPPSLPNAAVLEPYHQPLFEFDEVSRTVEVVGYVDTASELCTALAAIPTDSAGIEAFRTRHGFHPGQCRISRGVLEHPQTFVESYVTALDAEGFTVHAHAIGDRAARLAVDAFETAREANGGTGLPHNIAHAQFVHPDDQRRAGALGLFVTLTFAWIETAPEYDMTVAPFVVGVHGRAMYERRSPYTANTYPARTMADAGVTVVAGSDAPVDTPEPRPFFNLQQAITRSGEAGVLGEHQRLDVYEAVAAYTIDGARALRQSDR